MDLNNSVIKGLWCRRKEKANDTNMPPSPTCCISIINCISLSIHKYCINPKFWDIQAGTKSVDQDLMQMTASDQSLYCLLLI